MQDPVAAASQFSGFPVWVLLDPFASFGECRNNTTASSLTSAEVPIEVSFELVDPPRVSRWFVHRVGRKRYRGFNGPPHILNSSGSFMVIRMSLYRASDRVLDYFVYKSGPGKPSLNLIPGPCPMIYFPKQIGILPSDDGGHYYSVIFPVAELRDGPMYEIRVFSSADQSWSTKFASRDSQTTYLQAVVHRPSKAIAVGRGSLAWIDLWRGVLMCDGLQEDNPVLRLIKWPVPLPCRNAMDLYAADGSRDATLSDDGTIRFVEIKFHYSCGCFNSRDAIPIPIGWTATMWKRRCTSKEWETCFEVDIAKILTHHSSSSDLLRKLVWDTKLNKLDLNKVSSAPPILSLNDEDVVYFMTNLFSNEALLVAVNARNKKVEVVEQTSFELPFSPYSFSSLLDASSGIDTTNQLDECKNRDNAECIETFLLSALDELKDIEEHLEVRKPWYNRLAPLAEEQLEVRKAADNILALLCPDGSSSSSLPDVLAAAAPFVSVNVHNNSLSDDVELLVECFRELGDLKSRILAPVEEMKNKVSLALVALHRLQNFHMSKVGKGADEHGFK